MNQIGLIGLATMGHNLALNFADKEINIAVFNRDYNKTRNLTEQKIPYISGYENLTRFVQSIQRPRHIILLVKAGQPVDLIIEQLTPHLQKGDILIDMGNSHWQDTRRRKASLKNLFLEYVGCGISGGSDGALKGPCLMPGGDKTVVDGILPILEKITAKDFNNQACVANVGLDFAGHFVKTVHNGIEYAVMQGIAEIYSILKAGGLEQSYIADIIEESGQKPSFINGFLLDTAIKALRTKASGDRDLLPMVDQAAGSKGTGRWTVEAALEFGVAVPTIAEAVFARTISQKAFLWPTGTVFQNTGSISSPNKEDLIANITNLLEMLYLVSFWQGLDLINKANIEQNLQIDLRQLLRIWQGGCIIRTSYLTILDDWLVGKKIDFGQTLTNSTHSLNSLTGGNVHITLPVLDSGHNYLKGLWQAMNNQYPTNLVQLQRNIFGEHPITINNT